MKILAIGAHTDDIELGCGATIAKFRKAGHEIEAIVFCDITQTAKPDGILREECLNSLRFLGIYEPLIYHEIVINRKFSVNRQVILEKLIENRRPYDLIFTHSPHDLHQDHQVIAAETKRAFPHSTILTYETALLGDDFTPNMFIPVSEANLDKKCEALDNYESQLKLERPYFRRDFILSKAIVRGSQAGVQYAEAFQVEKFIYS